MNTAQTINNTGFYCKQDLILAIGPVAGEFFNRVLGMSINDVLITDESQLSDFSFSGSHELSFEDPSQTLKQAYRVWDAWVLGKIHEEFDIEVSSTRITLIALFAQLEAATNVNRLLH